MEIETAYGLSKVAADRYYEYGRAILFVLGLLTAVVSVALFWSSKARDELARRAVDPNIFETRGHEQDGKIIVEMWPRGGSLHPFVVVVPNAERGWLLTVNSGPPGVLPNAAMVLGSTDVQADGAAVSGIQIENMIDVNNHAYAWFSQAPSPTYLRPSPAARCGR